MPTAKAEPPRLHYRTLATHLSALDRFADCAELLGRLREFEGAERLCKAVERLPMDAEWFIGLRAVAETLKRENPRFDVGMFEEWCCERL